MVRITKAEYDRIGNDYKSTYQDYQGNLPPGSRTRGGTY